MAPLARVQNFTVSRDGYGSGEGQSAERPFGHADGKDVRIGGGVATVREFLDADLVDTLHVAVAPIELGRGERLWTSPDDLTDRFHPERVPSPSGVVHHFFWRT
ncbi:dihydrofolate reductase family protein [Nocardia puris]|nr:dihydrofolate reductase family protein [Nocardia puris]MBF6213366.1 dihydrofolate reductase family protein [Nocardia puris]MBF6369466.1 dihydrofolate reductase family protein [Nocardia puris]MBF6462245.1 dihydrofolate reductase family protein [Nocardia puris]